MYYFKPLNKVYDRNQIQGLVGLDPEITHADVLSYLGIHKVSRDPVTEDLLSSPEPSYEVIEGTAYQLTSCHPLPLGEAKEKTRQILLEQCRNRVRELIESSGFPSEFLAFAESLEIPSFCALKLGIEKEADILKSRMTALEKARTVDEVRKILGTGKLMGSR